MLPTDSPLVFYFWPQNTLSLLSSSVFPDPLSLLLPIAQTTSLNLPHPFHLITIHTKTQLSCKKHRSSMAVSNNITAILNFFALLSSIPIIGTGIWLASKQDNECIRFIRWPVILIGILILLVSLAGFVGAFWNQQCLLALHLFCMIILIVLLLALLVFAFVVTTPNGAYTVQGMKEYRLQGYSAWLRNYVSNSKHWDQIRRCLSSSSVCTRLNERFITPQQFFAADISPLQAGCCKPPTICGYSYVNPTLWINPINQGADVDCYMWSNDQTQLCYGCNSCKAGLLGNLRKEWRKANVVMIVALVVLVWVYIIACSAFRNAQTEDLFRRYKEGFAY